MIGLFGTYLHDLAPLGKVELETLEFRPVQFHSQDRYGKFPMLQSPRQPRIQKVSQS